MRSTSSTPRPAPPKPAASSSRTTSTMRSPAMSELPNAPTTDRPLHRAVHEPIQRGIERRQRGARAPGAPGSPGTDPPPRPRAPSAARPAHAAAGTLPRGRQGTDREARGRRRGHVPVAVSTGRGASGVTSDSGGVASAGGADTGRAESTGGPSRGRRQGKPVRGCAGLAPGEQGTREHREQPRPPEPPRDIGNRHVARKRRRKRGPAHVPYPVPGRPAGHPGLYPGTTLSSSTPRFRPGAPQPRKNRFPGPIRMQGPEANMFPSTPARGPQIVRREYGEEPTHNVDQAPPTIWRPRAPHAQQP